MANLFDYFVERRKRQDEILRGGLPQKTESPVELTMPVGQAQRPPIRDIPALVRQSRSQNFNYDGGVGQLQPTTVTPSDVQQDPFVIQPRNTDYPEIMPTQDPLVVGQRDTNVPAIEYDPLQQRRDELQTLRDTKAVNNDKGFGGLLLDIFRQAIISGGQAWNNSSGDPNQRLASALGGMAVGGAYGGFNPAVDEERKRQYDIYEKQRQIGELERQREVDTQNEYNQARVKSTTRGIDQKDRRLNQQQIDVETRRSRADYQKLNNEQKTALSGIFKRGYYKEGDNPEEDARLAQLDIILPDFDSRPRKYVEQNGTYYEIRQDGTTVPVNGVPTDESEIPVEYSIGGKTFKMRPRDIANIEAANQRQQSQQNWQSSENEKNRQQRREEFITNYKYKVQQDVKQLEQQQGDRATKLAQWKANQKRMIEQQKAAGKMDEKTYNAMIGEVDAVQ